MFATGVMGGEENTVAGQEEVKESNGEESTIYAGAKSEK